MQVYSRSYEKYLSAWLARRDRRPLVVRGARQIGKSYLIRHWAKKAFPADSVLEINLEESLRFRKIFTGELSADSLLDQLNLLTGVNLREGKKLLFIDEIQRVPSALVALRFFYEQFPSLPVIAAGSLLEFAIQEEGVPVGRIEYMHMSPMSFREFLHAFGKVELGELLASVPLTQALPLAVHEELLGLLRLYVRVGGMPKAVQAYCDTRDIREVGREQELLLATYQEDFPKYARKTQLDNLQEVFSRIPECIGMQRVQYTKIFPHTRVEKVKRCVELLERAHIVSKITCSLAQKAPLALGEKVNFFKILFLDIGLLQHALGFDWQKIDPDEDIANIRHGQFAEQFVGQEMIAEQSGLNRHKLFYWDRHVAGSDAEVDYLIEEGASLAPVEVKSGFQGSLKSLHLYRKEMKPKKSYILSQRNIEQDGDMHWVPLYFAGRLG